MHSWKKKKTQKTVLPELVHHHCFFWFIILPEALCASVVNREGGEREKEGVEVMRRGGSGVEGIEGMEGGRGWEGGQRLLKDPHGAW